MLKWYEFVLSVKEDIVNIVVYEIGKFKVEVLGEVDYVLGFFWWFVGEVECVWGLVVILFVFDWCMFVIK